MGIYVEVSNIYSEHSKLNKNFHLCNGDIAEFVGLVLRNVGLDSDQSQNLDGDATTDL